MDLPQLIEAMSSPAAYPYPVEGVEVRQTHISVVFLAGAFVYKIKKPVRFDFLDFSTLEQRRHFCEEEVRLNRRLAPDVYLGVVPILQSNLSPVPPLRSGAGAQEGEAASGTPPLRVGEAGQAGQVIEWAVKMKRLPEEATLQRRLLRGEVDSSVVQAVARRLAAFHAGAQTNERIASFGRFEVVAGNARENFEQARPHVGVTVSRTVFDRLEELTKESLRELRE